MRKREHTVSFLEDLWEQDETLATSAINVGEVLRGAQRSRDVLGVTTRTLDALEEVPFGAEEARRFGRLMHTLDRGGNRIPVVDGMVAAVALENGGRLVTRNVQHFDRVPGLELLAPEEV